MPRQARVVLPHHPHHVVQRGHNRHSVFTKPEDYDLYLANLAELKTEFDVKVYAWCLMTNHVHLLLAPGDDATRLARMMKVLAARATRHRNRVDCRSGTLWEGRYKSSVVQTEAYLLNCCLYIELNPVRAGMVSRPDDYRWSSYRARMGWSRDSLWMDHDPCFLSLGSSCEERRARYMELLAQGVPERETDIIRKALQRGQLTGTHAFVDQVARINGHRTVFRGQGRPRSVK